MSKYLALWEEQFKQMRAESTRQLKLQLSLNRIYRHYATNVMPNRRVLRVASSRPLTDVSIAEYKTVASIVQTSGDGSLEHKLLLVNPVASALLPPCKITALYRHRITHPFRRVSRSRKF
jgi:hypothetical protein